MIGETRTLVKSKNGNYAILSLKIRSYRYLYFLNRAPVMLSYILFSIQVSASDQLLWRKAVDIAGKNQYWIPGLTINRTSGNDKKDDWLGITQKLQTLGNNASRMILGEDGRIIVQQLDENMGGTGFSQHILVEADGRSFKDYLIIVDDKELILGESTEEQEQWQHMIEEAKGKDIFDPRFQLVDTSDDTFFDHQQQSSVIVTPTTEQKVIGKKTCVAYQFCHQIEDAEEKEGIAWLDRESGMPMEVEFTSIPLPEGAKTWKMTILYSANSSEAWYPHTIIEEGTMRVMGFKKRFQIYKTYSEYWKYPVDGEFLD
jgi:hypothetical protein